MQANMAEVANSNIHNNVGKKNSVPGDWQKLVIVPLLKNKGKNRECETCWGILLISRTGKIYAKILEQLVSHTKQY